RRTRSSAHESELPMWPAWAFWYIARKRRFTEKARSSSLVHSAVVSRGMRRVLRAGSSFADTPERGNGGRDGLRDEGAVPRKARERPEWRRAGRRIRGGPWGPGERPLGSSPTAGSPYWP